MTAEIAALIERVRKVGDPDAARELADLVEQAMAMPDKRVGAAFKIRRKGGEPRRRAERRVARDNAIRDLARAIGSDLSLEQQALAIVRRTSRYRAAPYDESGDGERQALRRIADTGLLVPGQRQVKRILSDMQTPLWMSEKLPQLTGDIGENDAGNGG